MHIFKFIACFIILSSLLKSYSANANELWKKKTKDVFILGQSILDFSYKVDNRQDIEDLLLKFKIQESHSQLVNKKTINHLLHNLRWIKKSAGGSASNTAAGLAQMGSNVSFKSVVGNDALGDFYLKEMKRYGINDIIATSSLDQTGIVYVIISPQSNSSDVINRTMVVYPGISNSSQYYETTAQEIEDYKIVFTEGYLWEKCSEEIKKLFFNAKNNNSITAFTFGDVYIVKKYKDDFLSLIKHIDILFADEDQILALYQSNDLDLVMHKLQENNNIVIITMGAKGAYIVTANNIQYIPVVKTKKLIDITGAGDQFAAGFLNGYLNNHSIEESGRLASIKAAEIINVIGAKPVI